MRRTLLPALALLLAAAAHAAGAPTAPSPGQEMALLADFVEVGRVDRSAGRDVAMVELLNLSPHVLDVVVGEGSATLKPKERMIARVAAGDRDVTVRARETSLAAMEGRLHLAAGLRYELALATGPAPEVRPAIAVPGIDGQAPTADVAPLPADGSVPARGAAAGRQEPRRTKGGKVDVGRRRR